MSSAEDCQLRLADAVRIAGDLNKIVVTLDRIFPRIAFDEAGPDLLLSYLADRNVRMRLATARTVIFDSVEKTIGREAADEVAEAGNSISGDSQDQCYTSHGL